MRFVLILAVATVYAEDWNPRLAAQYLDARQKEWAAWPAAKAAGGTCISCHTGMTYLLARPALRRALGENQPTTFETAVLDGLRARLPKRVPEGKEPQASQKLGVEAILAALFLTGPDAETAFDRLWPLQVREGKSRGAWAWFEFNLDPWESPESEFFGASLAAMAVGNAPSGYRARPEIRERVKELTGFLQRGQEAQPLHNRLALLWASSRLPGLLTDAERRAVAGKALSKQEPDGGWSTESLGPWREHAQAAPDKGANSYATAFAAFTLQQGGVRRDDPAVRRALGWLRSHQDSQSGAWTAVSMNKRYEAGSMQSSFMQDAATAFAVMALLESR